MQRIISGTTIEFTSFIFSIPHMTTMPPIIAVTSPSMGRPVILRMTNSPPASMEQSDMPAERNMQKPMILFFGISECFPATRKSAHRSDINTEDSATLSGDASPKNSAISLPEEKPAPIAVPI